MSSEAQVRANRENAQKSTGPTSPEGKARSSRNALTHGLLSCDIVTFGEDAEELECLPRGVDGQAGARRGGGADSGGPCGGDILAAAPCGRMEMRFTYIHYFNHYRDQGKLEELTAEERSNLSDNISALILANERFVSNLDRHEAHIERGFYKALHELKKLQAERADDGGRRTEKRRQTTEDGGQAEDKVTQGEGNAEASRGRAQAVAGAPEEETDSAKRSQSGAEGERAAGEDDSAKRSQSELRRCGCTGGTRVSPDQSDRGDAERQVSRK